MSEINCQQDHAPSKGSRGGSIPCYFQKLLLAAIPWLVAQTPQSLIGGSHILLSSPFLISLYPPPI